MENIFDMKLSQNGKYILANGMVYDISLDESVSINDLSFGFWFDFIKENSISSLFNKTKTTLEIQKILRETVYNISEIFDTDSKLNILIEYETKFGNNLLIESEENLSSIINETFDFVKSKLLSYGILSEQSWWDKTKNFVSSTAKKISDKVSGAWNWVKEKGAGWFFENLRTALFSWGGAAVQAFLSSGATAGIGNVVLVIVWGAMLAYDLYLAVGGNVNWVNLIIDIIGIATTGPGAKIVGEAFKKLGIFGKKLPLNSILQTLSKSSVGKWFVGVIEMAVKGLSGISNTLTKGITWLAEKFGINFTNSSGQLQTFLNKAVTDISSSPTIKTVAGKVGQKAGKTLVKNVASKVGKAASTKVGQTAVAGGATYGINKKTGANTDVLGGAFKDKPNQEQELYASLGNTKPTDFVDGVDF
jgi:predicted heme/steroid binding protein